MASDLQRGNMSYYQHDLALHPKESALEDAVRARIPMRLPGNFLRSDHRIPWFRGEVP